METIKTDPEVMRIALEIAGNDRSRLELCKDGSVVVHNGSRRNAKKPPTSR